ncbi:MAG: Holliday junction resolvase RuvX [Salinivirgaceae bacterium]|nr:Holliday junction resolvase RuvX [Salinivirgaceae bacterium]
MGRILAIDYGRKRCGVAVTDVMQIIATGLQTVPTAELMNFLKQYVQKEQVDTFVVGHAKQMDATDSESMQYIKPFVEKLKKEFTNTPVEMIDERFTSKIAFQAMIDGGLKKKQRQDKALIDTVSATIILQSYMEQKQRK